MAASSVGAVFEIKAKTIQLHVFGYIYTYYYDSNGLGSSVGIAAVRGSNPGGSAIFRTRPDWPWGPLSLL
jgi:hypothetical protein